MSYFNWKWVVLALVFCVLSCDKDIMPIEIASTDELDKQPEAKVEKIIRNGRFVFTSTASLNKTIEELQNGAPEKIASDFEKLYAVGFRSHKAIVNPNNEGLQAKFSKELMQKRQLRKSSINFSKESVVNDDEFIIDPAFASLVNENNEIIVNDTLYKIINDSGVFMVHVKDSLHLFQYLENLKHESSNKSYFNAYNTRLVGGGYSRINERISKYVRALGRFGYYGGGRGFSGINWTTTGSAFSEEIKLQNVISNLKKCGIKEPAFPGLFGNSLVCIDKFDSKHRIKTEFWDQSWGFYKSAGVLTKTQRRRYGIWWRSNADEIHLGINKILLKYNVLAPEILKQKQPSDIHSDFIKFQKPIFLYDNNYYTKNLSFYSSYMGTAFNNLWYPTTLKIKKNKIPFFKFADTDILNIYIPLQKYTGFIKDVKVNITVGNSILSDSNIKNLYKSGFDFLKSIGSSKKEFVVTYQLNPKEVEVLYFAQKYNKKNANIIKVKMFEDRDFLVGYSNFLNGEGGKFSVDFSPITNVNHRKFTHYEIDFYGLAKRDGKWRGSRLIR